MSFLVGLFLINMDSPNLYQLLEPISLSVVVYTSKPVAGQKTTLYGRF